VGQVYAFWQGILEDGEAVVLARDLDAPVLQVPDRVVRPVVPERHLVRLATQSQAESWWPRQIPKTGTSPSAGRRVSTARSWPPGPRAVRQKEAVGVGVQDLLRLAEPGIASTVAPRLRSSL
jgi:hypothetical protein